MELLDADGNIIVPESNTTMIPNEFLDRYMSVIGTHGTLVYITLLRYAEGRCECSATYAALQAKTGLAKSSVEKAIKNLIFHNMISKYRSDIPSGKQSNHVGLSNSKGYYPNLYVILNLNK